MHGTTPTEAYIAGDLIGFTAGLAISVLLLVLTLRAAKLPGTPVANVVLALCSLAWNLGGLMCAICLALGFPRGSRPGALAAALQFTGAAAWPLPLIAIWRPFATAPRQKIWTRALFDLACFNAIVLAGLLWSEPIFGVSYMRPLTVYELTAFNGSILLIVGLILLRGQLTSRTIWLGSMAILLGVLGSSVSIIILEGFKLGTGLSDALTVLSEQSPLLIVLGAFFLFARFRFADLFIRHGLRLLLAGLAALSLVLLINASLVNRLLIRLPFAKAGYLFLATSVAAVLLLAFAFGDQRLEKLVNQGIFRAPDYRKAARQLGERLLRLYSESELAAAIEDAARSTLELSDVRVISVEDLLGDPRLRETAAGELIELDETDPLRNQLPLPAVELLVPVSSGGKILHHVAISPGPLRRGLVTQETEYLRMVSAQFGNRLDSLRLEREMFERRSREAVLLQQVTEAELRALRAQVNPHFLFNSLNTIANLVVTDPVRAEAMILRLARVFRYVLAHSSQSMTSIGEEVEFLRTYLEIEEARFGERLKVEFEIAPDVTGQPIPSLLMQPLVENALKHGLAPKPGSGRLWISAKSMGNQICIKVEDDGVGLQPSGLEKTNGNYDPTSGRKETGGVGVANVAQRLATLYKDRARLRVEQRETGGTRVSLIIPRENGVAVA